MAMEAWNAYYAELQHLWISADRPSSRAIRDRAGGSVSHTTVNLVLRGGRLPQWPVMLQVLKGLGASPSAVDRFRGFWERAVAEVAPDPPEAPAVSVNVAILQELRAIRVLLERYLDESG